MEKQHHKIKSAAESFTCSNEKLGHDSKSYPIGKEEYSKDIIPFDVTSNVAWVIRKFRGGFRSNSTCTVVCACDPDDGKMKPIATWGYVLQKYISMNNLLMILTYLTFLRKHEKK
jgi:hypothetical protein